MKVLQINTDRRVAAIDLVFQSAADMKADVILISEPNRARVRRNKKWYVDTREDCCIINRNPNIEVNAWGRGRGFVWIRTGELAVYCVYISPNVDKETYQAFLTDLSDSIQERGSRIIIGGDFNAKSPMWGSAVEDWKGNILSEWALGRGLIPVNTGDAPTFQRGSSESIIDITWATESVYRKITKWRVLEEETGSLHRYIGFEVDNGGTRSGRSWGRGKLCIQRLKATIDSTAPPVTTEVAPFIEYLKTTQKKSMARVARDMGGGDTYWWTEDIGTLRSAALAKRRKLTRSSGRRDVSAEVIEALREEYKTAKKALKKAIATSKKRCWNKLCRDLEDDIWGEGFKIMMRSLKLSNPRVDIDITRRIEVTDVLFPRVERREWVDMGRDIPPPDKVTMEEVKTAADRLKSNRAPGPDGILPETIKTFANSHGPVIADIFDGLLRAGSFPSIWKKACLVLVPKPGKDVNEASGFRPICLLDTMGKLFEAVIVERLQRELDARAPLHERQYGFRKGRSAIDAVYDVLGTIKRAGESKLRALVLLDVKNAFNSANWQRIEAALVRRGISGGLLRIIRDYLDDRHIMICQGHQREINIGVPQGSILGPTLWNVLYDEVLRIRLPTDARLVAYADDLALTIVDNSMSGLVEKTNDSLERVDRWMLEQGLELAPEKTEVIVFSMRRLGNMTFRIRNAEIRPGKTVKYLGVIVDRHLNFGEHISSICVKADRTAGAILRLMPNISGPPSSKRRVLAQVVYSGMMYAAPIWSRGLAMAKYQNMITAVQRKVALRIASAYRTVSTDAILVIAGQIPIDILADERKRVYEEEGITTPALRKQQRRESLAKWQERFNTSNKGRWTARLIKDIPRWYQREHGEVDYYVTQFLSGHGSFADYLFKIGKRADDGCLYCGRSDSAEHTVFHCFKFEGHRATMHRVAGRAVTADDVIELALRDKQAWKIIMGTIHDIIMIKESDMRAEELNP